MVADGTVEADYADEIIACIEKYGPYIIIAPDIAMPHSQENAKGVHKTAISFMKVALIGELLQAQNISDLRTIAAKYQI